jgi:hypothetical protein
MAAHKGPASLRPSCTRGGSSVAAIPVYPVLLLLLLLLFLLLLLLLFSLAVQPSVVYGLLFHEVSCSYTTRQSVALSRRVISSSQRPLPHNTQHTQHTKTYALDRAATGTGCLQYYGKPKQPSRNVCICSRHLQSATGGQ